MRLTNVARMTLPAGEVHSYALRVADEPGRRLPVSFDQGRHVGGGDRDGSWMSIAFRLPEGTARDALADAWHRVVRRHGTLRTAFTRIVGTDELALHDVEVIGGRWRRHPIPSGALARDVLRVVLDGACRPFSRPSHLLVVVEPDADAADRRPAVVIGSDHAHVDMWSLLVLVRDLIAGLDGALPESAAGDISSAAGAVEPFAVHTALLEARPPAPAEVTARWREITRVTRALSGAPLRAVFPVHSRFEQRWHDAVGWFITNSVIECRDADPAACAAAVRQAVALGSHPLAPILAPYGGMPVAPGMFALSWLDTRRLPVDLPPDLQIQYVSSVIESDDVMVWFVVNDSGLHLRYRCPDTPEATASVVRWVDAATTALRVLADAEVAVA
ncbi:hypothetical protein [Microbacterium sp. Marseille-Q6648]|uniref:hypothetical protein n=1 Tax=Microbacterium sp. Marseille-Q6648 TaxID=2937991 RepID=UPI002041CDE3|nr:hypothetical protein [Microbacterium sp. Marseille-Q6648]